MIRIDDLQKYDRPICIWGTGVDAVKLSYRIDTLLNIAAYVDNAKSDFGIRFLGKDVYTCEEMIKTKRKSFFLIATSWNSYLKIREQLESYGLEEFNDFVFGDLLEKQMVLINGNCHTVCIREGLQSVIFFRENYCIYPWYALDKRYKFPKRALEECDIFIHQDIRPNNEWGYKFSDEYMLSKLNKNAVSITIPNLYGLGNLYFPQIKGESDNNKALCAEKDNVGMFPEYDEIIETYLDEYKNDNEIAEEKLLLQIDDYYTREQIIDNFNLSLSKMRMREKNWDIKIVDFIVEKYKEVKLFYEPFHPTNILMIEIVKRLLDYLGVAYGEIIVNSDLGEHEVPILQCVKKYLELEWDDKYIRNGAGTKNAANYMDLKEYVHQYIWWRIQNMDYR